MSIVDSARPVAVIRQGYVRGTRLVASAADATGLDQWLAARDSALAFQVRSMLALYDVQRMVRLDVPWWTYKATHEVEHFLACHDGAARVFEYGAGASTVWLAQRAGQVHSVEHDPQFARQLRTMLDPLPHLELSLVAPTRRRPDSTAVSGRQGYEKLDFADYVATIHRVGGQFDLVVVDGRARSACLEAALSHLAPQGMVVFDNACRSRYRQAIEASGLAVDLQRGWAPCLPYRDATALLRPRRP